MRLSFALAVALLVLSACDRAEPDNVAANASMAEVPDEQVLHNTSGPVSAPPAPIATAVLDRLGPLKVGVTIGALAAEGVQVDERDDPMEGSTCSYATFTGVRDVTAMLDGDRIVRIDVQVVTHEGPGGLRVGQSEAEALRRLGPGVTVEPHPYTGPEGHYLVWHQSGAPFGLIAETDGARVERWRIGQWDEVQWIEGCS